MPPSSRCHLYSALLALSCCDSSTTGENLGFKHCPLSHDKKRDSPLHILTAVRQTDRICLGRTKKGLIFLSPPYRLYCRASNVKVSRRSVALGSKLRGKTWLPGKRLLVEIYVHNVVKFISMVHRILFVHLPCSVGVAIWIEVLVGHVYFSESPCSTEVSLGNKRRTGGIRGTRERL